MRKEKSTVERQKGQLQEESHKNIDLPVALVWISFFLESNIALVNNFHLFWCARRSKNI